MKEYTKIRRAHGNDTAEVLRINREAFGGEKGVEVSNLVAALLADSSAEPRLSLLALRENEPVGHILFSHAVLRESDRPVVSAILAPLAVLPEHQSKGVGGLLIREGVALLVKAGVDLVFVLGHPDYYPRHGFTRACPLGFLACYQERGTPNDAWMVRELALGALSAAKGTIRCADALDELRHWRE